MSGAQCFECGQPANHFHHVVPASKGGTQTVPLCLKHHEEVHDRKMAHSALTRAALSKKQELGEWVGRPPFGWKVVDGTLVLDEPSFTIRRQVHELHSAGKSASEICRELGLSRSAVRRILLVPSDWQPNGVDTPKKYVGRQARKGSLDAYVLADVLELFHSLDLSGRRRLLQWLNDEFGTRD